MLCACGATFGQQAADSTTAKPAGASGNDLLKKSREKVASHQSVKAELRQKVMMGARRFEALGIYLQAPGDKIRIELKLKPTLAKGKKPKPNAMNSGVLKVSDGRILWTQIQLGKELSIQRCDVQEVNKAVGEISMFANSAWLRDLGMGGLKSMLAGLDANLDFKAAEEAEIDGKSFLMVSGTWKDARRKSVLGDAAKPDDPLPPYIPDLVMVYFHKDTLFPRQIMYLKLHPEQKHKARPMVKLDFVNVAINESLPAQAFKYAPPEGALQQDTTNQTIEQLKQVGAGPPRGE